MILHDEFGQVEPPEPPLVPLPRWVKVFAALVYAAIIAWAIYDGPGLDPFASDALWRYEIPASVDRSRLVKVRPW